jgi:ferrous iron transport protein B
VRTYQWSEDVSEKCIPSQKSRRDAPDSLSGKIDGILLHPFLGLLFFIFSMALIFSAIFWLAQPAMDLIEALFSTVQAFFVAKIDPSWGRDLFVEGVIGGISGVVVFLPQIVILFFALGFFSEFMSTDAGTDVLFLT